MADLNRERIIELLNRLGSDDDAEVVGTARTLHGEVTAAGLGWDALLTPEDYEDPTIEDDDLEEEEDEAEPEPEPEPEIDIDPEAFAGKVSDSRDAESLALIERLLAQRQLGEATREELKGYKEDIAEGDFEESDRKYLRTLHARISKRR
jgi:hypothetical protein